MALVKNDILRKNFAFSTHFFIKFDENNILNVKK